MHDVIPITEITVGVHIIKEQSYTIVLKSTMLYMISMFA